MIKRFAGYLLFALVYFYSLSILTPAINAWIYTPMQKNFLSETYIKTIDLPSKEQIAVFNTLQQFNGITEGKSVKYSGKRPIIITMVDEFESPTILGKAMPTIFSCNIELRKGLPIPLLKKVFIHEYVHCFGIGHTNDPCDLMYPTMNKCTTDDNIKKYANITRILLND